MLEKKNRGGPPFTVCYYFLFFYLYLFILESITPFLESINLFSENIYLFASELPMRIDEHSDSEQAACFGRAGGQILTTAAQNRQNFRIVKICLRSNSTNPETLQSESQGVMINMREKFWSTARR